jgi:hypothetical protein
MKPTDCDWRKLLGVPLYALANRRGMERLVLAIRALGSVVLKRPEKPGPSKGEILFVNSTARRDYRDVILCSYSACRQPKILWEVTYRSGLNVDGIGHLFRRLRDFRELRRVTGADLIGSFVLYAAWVKCIQFGTIADGLSYRAVVVAADMQLLESFLVQRANRAGLPSATCQHGLYTDNGALNSYDNINTINYLNCSSRYFLSWGGRTKALMEKYTDTQCVVVGNPAIPNVGRFGSGQYFYVLMDSDLRFRKYNERLLAIASEASQRLKLPFFVRFHPDNDPASYGRCEAGGDEHPLIEAAFAIAHLTSQMYVAMQSGVPVYRLTSSEPNHDIGEQFQFAIVEDLLAKNVPQHAFVELGTSFIEYVGEASAARCAAFFDRFVGQSSFEDGGAAVTDEFGIDQGKSGSRWMAASAANSDTI